MLLQGPLSAKAVGEPPLLLATSVLMALQSAVRAAASQTFGQPALPFKPLLAPANVTAVKEACGTGPLADVIGRMKS